MRGLVRFFSALLALAVAAAGVLLVLEVAWRWARPGAAPLLVPWPAWRASLSELTWTSMAVQVTALVVAVVGLVLLIVASTARSRDVRLHDPATEVSVTTSPRSLARLVGQHVRAQDNVTGATVTASARKVRVRALSRLETEQQLRPRLTESVALFLGDLPLTQRPKISVVVDSPKDRR
ncbi:DUF6286 domain-containing protein [Saccharomonospora sp. NPDC046836]|uniref:DUF6286 domain-containing protein n=1 Tax=Saccharomonospora sp. NPDC046836 TaxID=3156921 RepID=UPI00340B8B44